MGKKYHILVLCCIAISCSSFAQVRKNSIQKDTSFTNYSAFIKERKKYPFIKIADPVVKDSLIIVREVPLISFGNKRKLTGDFTRPAKRSSAGYPGVLLIHGGGWKSGDKAQMEPIAKFLASRGFVTLAVEYRLSPEAKYPAALHDIKISIALMKMNAKRYNIDTGRIAVLGVSSGGQLAALAGAMNGTKRFNNLKRATADVHAVVDIDGILAFKHQESEEGQVAAEWLGGTYHEQPKAWEEASPLSHAGKHFPPILFINSQHTRFHAGRDDLIEKLKQFNTYTQVETIPDTPHTFWIFDPWFDLTMNHVVNFLNKVLVGRQKTGKPRN